MIDPGGGFSPLILGIVFALLIAALVINAFAKDRTAFRRFSNLRSSKKRRRTMRRWLVSSVLLFGGSALVTTVLAWRYVPLLLADINTIGWVADARRWFDSGTWVSWSILITLVVLLVGFMVGAIFAARNDPEVTSLGDIQAMLPRNRKELPYGAALSINAGIVEEVLFRLAMPALVFAFTGNAIIAVVVSVLVFGGLHAYQGVAGVVGTTIVGALFMVIYLATGNILMVIVVHALFDLRSLVLIPVVINKVHQK